MWDFYSRLFFHKSGKPRGWLRRVLKEGNLHPELAARDEKRSAESPVSISQFLAALAASNGTVYRNVEQWYDAEHPEISVIVLNWNKSTLTAQCLHEIWKHTDRVRYEIVVLDNGSRLEDLPGLVGLPGPFRLIRLHTNRMFGEGNNIAAEAASAACLLVHKRLFEELDGFSLDFEPTYYDDVDLCFRLRRSGYQRRKSSISKTIPIENLVKPGTKVSS